MVARKKQAKGKKQADSLDQYTQVDVYYIPNEFVDMYRVLREAVAEEVTDLLSQTYPSVERLTIDPDEGEAIVAKDDQGQDQVRYYLNPDNMSQAQIARDKGQLAKHLEKFLPDSQD